MVSRGKKGASLFRTDILGATVQVVTEGGETNLDNCVLLCKRHHRMVHEGSWQLVKTQESEVVAIAPTITFGLPRGPDQPKE